MKSLSRNALLGLLVLLGSARAIVSLNSPSTAAAAGAWLAFVSPLPKVFGRINGVDYWAGQRLDITFSYPDKKISVSSQRGMMDEISGSHRLIMQAALPLVGDYSDPRLSRYLQQLLCGRGKLAQDFKATNSARVHIRRTPPLGGQAQELSLVCE